MLYTKCNICGASLNTVLGKCPRGHIQPRPIQQPEDDTPTWVAPVVIDIPVVIDPPAPDYSGGGGDFGGGGASGSWE